MVATKAANPTSRKAPSRLKGGEQAEAKPSHATRSSAVSNEAVRNPSTLRRVYPQSSRMSWVRDHRDSCDIRRRADPAPLITHRPFAKSYSTFCFAVTNICFTLRHHEDEGLQTTAAGRLLAGRLARALRVVRAHAPYLLLPFGSQRAVLLGSDARAGEGSRSDTIMVAKAGGGLLAVPRDTLVQIPGIGEDKINAAFANGGPPLAVETLENFTGLPIGNYVVLDFGGTKEIVDALGGIMVNVEEPVETEQDGEY